MLRLVARGRKYDVGDVTGYRQISQTVTACECPNPDVGNTSAEHHTAQVHAETERVVPYAATVDRHTGEIAARRECTDPDAGDITGNRNAGQTRVKSEGKISEIGDIVTDHNVAQAGTGTERKVSNTAAVNRRAAE